LLTRMGLDVEVVPSEIEECSAPGESPRDHVIRLARAKAFDAGTRYPDRWVIGADTIVYAEGTILGKPKGREEASEMLGLLSGRKHQVLTGFSVCHLKKGKADQDAVQTAVRVKSLTQKEIQWYIGTEEPFDKAGAYAIQGIGSFMIESIHGSYTNVVGLPMCELVQMMERLGAIEIHQCKLQIVN
jgi:septum formation protein